jgi:hypothetical protein
LDVLRKLFHRLFLRFAALLRGYDHIYTTGFTLKKSHFASSNQATLLADHLC